MDRFAHGQFQVAYEARVDVGALRQKRIANAQRRREEAQLEALLVWKDENVRYLTDLRPQLIAGKTTALNGALLIADHPPILFCSGGERDRAERTMPWITEIHTIPIIEERSLIEGFVRAILSPVLQKHGLMRARIGMDEANTSLVQLHLQIFAGGAHRRRRYADATRAQDQASGRDCHARRSNRPRRCGHR